MRFGKWKALRSAPDQKFELYDLVAGLGVEKNLAAENPDAVARLAQIMQDARAELEFFSLQNHP